MAVAALSRPSTLQRRAVPALRASARHVASAPISSSGTAGRDSVTNGRDSGTTGHDPGTTGRENRALAKLRTVAEDCRSLTKATWRGEPAAHAEEAIVLVENITRSLAALRTELLTEIERAGSWSSDGERTLQSWVSNRTGGSRNTAAKNVGLSKSLTQDLPQTRDALANGIISEDHAHVIARECTKSDTLRNLLKDPARGEAALLEQAREMNATRFAKAAKSWAIQNDPRGADRSWRKDVAKEELTLTTSTNGTRISGWLTAANGTLLAEALSSHMGRKAADDTRSFPERYASALVSMAHQGLNSGLQLPNARIRPQITITMEYQTLQDLVTATASSNPSTADRPHGKKCAPGEPDPTAWATAWQPGEDHVIQTRLNYDSLAGTQPGTLPDGTPLAPSELARFVCSSALSRVIFGPESTVLDSGRQERLFTASQTRAIIARDRHCQYPGCADTPNRCEIHHSLEWFKHRGATHVDLGILLCWHHHSLVHERGVSITRSAATWVFRDRHGQLIHPPGSRYEARPDPNSTQRLAGMREPTPPLRQTITPKVGPNMGTQVLHEAPVKMRAIDRAPSSTRPAWSEKPMQTFEVDLFGEPRHHGTELND